MGQKWGKLSAILCPSMPFGRFANRYKKAPKPFVRGAWALFLVNTKAQSVCVRVADAPTSRSLDRGALGLHGGSGKRVGF